jgi:hypothetical protein
MFKRAMALDPAFAQPRAGLADADINLLQWLLVAKDAQPALRTEALEASGEALRLDPELPEAHVARRAVGTGRGYRPWIEHDPDLDTLRGLPRFQQIVARLPP